MSSSLKQLVPGNPGSSFLVAILYIVQHKYKLQISNETQLVLFARGIVKSRDTFFGMILNEVAREFDKQITVFSNHESLLWQAKREIDAAFIRTQKSALEAQDLEKILDKYGYLAVSVDLFLFRNYHDYHFVCVSRAKDGIDAYDPKTGKIFKFERKELGKLTKSITEGLSDSIIAFAI